MNMHPRFAAGSAAPVDPRVAPAGDHPFWIADFDGARLDLIAPTPAQVDLERIGETLANICRFGGRSGTFYSVAEHSVLCCDHASPSAAAYALLHDAHEAWIGDFATPVKTTLFLVLAGIDGRGMPTEDGRALPAALASGRHTMRDVLEARFRAWEDRHLEAIHIAAGLAWPPAPSIAAEVKHLDLRALVTERRDLMGRQPRPWSPATEAAKPFSRSVRKPLTPALAAMEWIDRARNLLPLLKHRR